MHADETTHIESAKKQWAWIGVSSNMTVFAFNKSRGKKAAQNLLGTSFQGYLVSDRYAAYNIIPSNMRQIFGVKFLRQRPILNFIVDFFAPEIKLA